MFIIIFYVTRKCSQKYKRGFTMRNGIISLVIVAVAVLLVNGCATKKPTHGDIKGETITITTGDWYEACDKWSAGDKVNIAFSSSKPVMFEVHYHKVRSNEKIYAVEQTLLDTFNDSIIVESEEIYCCMWKNDNPDYITLTYDMSIDK